jgi:hypothetical protein
MMDSKNEERQPQVKAWRIWMVFAALLVSCKSRVSPPFVLAVLIGGLACSCIAIC